MVLRFRPRIPPAHPPRSAPRKPHRRNASLPPLPPRRLQSCTGGGEACASLKLIMATFLPLCRGEGPPVREPRAHFCSERDPRPPPPSPQRHHTQKPKHTPEFLYVSTTKMQRDNVILGSASASSTNMFTKVLWCTPPQLRTMSEVAQLATEVAVGGIPGAISRRDKVFVVASPIGRPSIQHSGYRGSGWSS